MKLKTSLVASMIGFLLLWGCNESNVQSSQKNQGPISQNNMKNGFIIDSLPDGTLISRGLQKEGMKEGEWEYFNRGKPNEATMIIYSSDSIIGKGFIRWHSQGRSVVDLKSISYYYSNDTCERNWGFTREGIHNYYSASCKSSKVDTVVFLRAEGDTATFSTAKNGTVIKSWRR